MMGLAVWRLFAPAKLAVSTAALLALMAIASSAASAEVTKEFDPVLSLTGGCTVSPLDEVPDPGCPEPPHPSTSFTRPDAVAVDSYGDIYVANYGSAADGSAGKIDVFGPNGVFITQVASSKGPRGLAVDSNGYLYVALQEGQLGSNEGVQEGRIVRLDPTTYQPQKGEINYDATPHVVDPQATNSTFISLAVNPQNDHLFANFGGSVTEYSAAEANEVVEEFSTGMGGPGGIGLAIDAARNLIYESNSTGGEEDVRVLKLAAPHTLERTIKGSAVPAEKFSGQLSVAVDEQSGHAFVLDEFANKLYEFDAGGNYVGTIEHGFQTTTGVEIAADNGQLSPNGGGLNSPGRYIFVPSHPIGVGHSFALRPLSAKCAPVVGSTSVGDVSETDAELRAAINPCNLPTTFRFEYTTRSRFEAEGFTGASVAVSGGLAAGDVDRSVAAGAAPLSPATDYVFRVVAQNEKGEDQGEGSFRTYPALPLGPCGNDGFRTGFSTLLPDCRAFELVTPPITNGRPPRGAAALGAFFATNQTAPDGSKVPFLIAGGAIPGTEGTGGATVFAGDPYMSTRGPAGWSTEYIGPSGSESPKPAPGSTSGDQGYSFFITSAEGTAAIEQRATTYVRYPDGHSAPVGRGDLGVDPGATGRYISPGGTHIIFETKAVAPPFQLEPDAPPPSGKVGTQTLYDRTPDEVTHVVSLLPGDVTPAAGENAEYLGVSTDGRGVAFAIGSKLYLRYDNSETYEVGGGVTFAGVSEGGSQVFYLQGGTLWRLDVLTGERTAFNSTGTVVPVNVSQDGRAAYFVSTDVLVKTANPSGAKAKNGQQNLYLSHEGSVSFVGTVTERDVIGEEIAGIESVDGLGLWIDAVGGRFGVDPSRTTADGRVLLFQSRADLTGYDPEGHVEVYRYDSGAGSLTCLSCNPTNGAASGDASLQSSAGEGGLQLLSSFVVISNLSADGQRAFFQSPDALVAGDTDQRQDVYEWEAQGRGSCANPGGCVYLISSGQSLRNDYLFAVTPSGEDVFFLTADRLLPTDAEDTQSLYDARVNGGFPQQAQAECQGEGCRPGMTSPPSLPAPTTSAHGGKKPQPRRCAKGKRKVKRHGKVRCVKKKHRRHRSKAGRGGKGAAK